MTADDAHQRWYHRVHALWRSPEFALLVMFFALCLVCVALFIQGPKVSRNTTRLDRQQRALSMQERKDNIVQRQTSYRVCARNAVDRAFAHDAVSRGPEGAKAVRHLERVLPILDCVPNLTGQPAHAMSPLRQRAFVRRWVRNELSLGEQGICSVPPTKPYC